MKFLTAVLIIYGSLFLISCLGPVQKPANNTAPGGEPPAVKREMKILAYKDEGVNQIYNLLFCDEIEAYRDSFTGSNGYPWNELFSGSTSDLELQKVFDDKSLETRMRLLAARLLEKRGQTITSKELLGVVIEVDMGDGLDTLAVFQDGSARYINYSERMIVWETTTPETDKLVRDLFGASRIIVDKIGPWDAERLPPPSNGNARLSFLVADGLYFGEAPQAVFMRDPDAGLVFQRGALIMNYLVDRSMHQPE